MFNKTFVYTSIFSALFMALSLKFLQLFDFVKWSPIGWFKKWQVLPAAHYSIKWLFLIVVLVILFAIVYLIISFLESIPPSVSALIFSIVAIVIIEWMISEPKTPIEAIRAISIPFLSITAIVLRFIAGTAVYMRKLSRKEGNELP